MDYAFSFGFFCGAVYMAVFDSKLRVQILINKHEVGVEPQRIDVKHGLERDLEMGE